MSKYESDSLSFTAPDKQPMDCQRSSSFHREQSDSTLEQESTIETREEDERSVHLHPRFDLRPLNEEFDCDHDRFSTQASCTDDSSNMQVENNDDEVSFVQLIPYAQDDPTAKRSLLCRSLAWSQDSLDDRVAKRNRPSEGCSPTSHSESILAFSFEQPHHRRQGSVDSLHWEEKVLDSVDLITFVQSNVSNMTMTET